MPPRDPVQGSHQEGGVSVPSLGALQHRFHPEGCDEDGSEQQGGQTPRSARYLRAASPGPLRSPQKTPRELREKMVEKKVRQIIKSELMKHHKSRHTHKAGKNKKRRASVGSSKKLKTPCKTKTRPITPRSGAKSRPITPRSGHKKRKTSSSSKSSNKMSSNRVSSSKMSSSSRVSSRPSSAASSRITSPRRRPMSPRVHSRRALSPQLSPRRIHDFVSRMSSPKRQRQRYDKQVVEDAKKARKQKRLEAKRARKPLSPSRTRTLQRLSSPKRTRIASKKSRSSQTGFGSGSAKLSWYFTKHEGSDQVYIGQKQWETRPHSPGSAFSRSKTRRMTFFQSTDGSGKYTGTPQSDFTKASHHRGAQHGFGSTPREVFKPRPDFNQNGVEEMKMFKHSRGFKKKKKRSARRGPHIIPRPSEIQVKAQHVYQHSDEDEGF